MTLGLAKLYSFVLGLFDSSFSCSVMNFGKVILTHLSNFFRAAINFFNEALWLIIKFALGILEALQYIIETFIGLNSTVDDYFTFAKNNDFLNMLVRTFRALLAVGIVLLLIFSIYAIIKQEVDFASTGFGADKKLKDNNKSAIIKGIFTRIMTMLLLPITMIFVLYGISSVLSSFTQALTGYEEKSTVAANLLCSTNYDSNRMRRYVEKNERKPIIIQAYDVDKYALFDDNTLLAKEIKSYEVQNRLINTNLLLQGDESKKLTFKESLKYSNDKFANSSLFGDYYESFICTPEQYQVMAEFIDYCTKTAKTFYIKSIDDKDIDWGYVDSAVFDQNNLSLTINYTDASDLDDDGSTKDTYKIVYQTSYEVTSPISDAMDAIKAMLGIGDYENLFNEMERENGSTNIVQWANEKALIKLSDTFNESDSSTWTVADQIIVYEYYHFKRNNTLATDGENAITINDLQNTGLELEALKLTYQNEILVDGEPTGALTEEATINCVLINGTYYIVEKSSTEADKDGNLYYVLKGTNVSSTNNTKFLGDQVVKITKLSNKTVLKLSRYFDINNVDSWTSTDQIIVYEYFKDITYKNSLSSSSFSSFTSGVQLDITYQISTVDLRDNSSTIIGNFALINNQYYRLNTSYELQSSHNFLLPSDGAGTLYYKFLINIDENMKDVGIESDNSFLNDVILDSVSGFKQFGEFSIGAGCEDLAEYYENFTYKLSKTFNYGEYSTWTFRDYFLFYLYLSYPALFSNNLESLRLVGLQGEIGSNCGATFTKSSQVYLKLANGKYLNVKKLETISERKITRKIDSEGTLQNNTIDTLDSVLFVNNFDSSLLLRADTDYIKLEFSENYSETNISTWTVKDMLLTAFARAGYFGNVTIDELKTTGYLSLVYKLQEVTERDDSYNPTKTNTYYLYRFGQAYNDANDSEKRKTVYLDSRKILNFNAGNDYAALVDSTSAAKQYNSMEEFFNSKAINFLMKYYSDLKIEDLVADEDYIVDNIYSAYQSNIITYDELFKLFIHSNNTFDIYGSLLEYTYTNNSYVFGDLSTWKALDAIIYALTGNFSGSYTSKVLTLKNGADTERFFIVGNYGVKLDETQFKIASDPSGKITSQTWMPSLVNYNTLKDFYNSTVSKLVKTDLDPSDLIRISNVSYKYTTGSATMAGRGDSYTISGSWTYFDVAIAMAKEALAANTNYNFDIYESKTTRKAYARLNGNAYFEISKTYGEQTVYSNKLGKIECLTANLFSTDTSTYKFKITKTGLTKTDAAFYALTNYTSEDELTYTVYKTSALGASLNKYICVTDINGKYFNRIIKVDNTPLKTYESDNAIVMETWIKNIYKDYYASRYTSNIDDISPTTFSGETVENVTYQIASFNVKDTSTWSPLKIILYSQGLISSESGTAIKISGQILTENGSMNMYFKFQASQDNVMKYHYINLQGICNLDVSAGNRIQDIDNFANLTLLSSGLYNIETNDYGKITNVLGTKDGCLNANFYTIENEIRTTYTGSIKDISGTNKNTTLSTNTMNLNDVLTWNFFDMAYYYLTNSLRSSDSFVVYGTSGDEYVLITTETESYYVNLKLDRSGIGITSSSENVVFEHYFDPIAIAYSKLSGVTISKQEPYTEYEFKKITYAGVSYYVYENNIIKISTIISGSVTTSTEVYTYEAGDSSDIFSSSLFDYILAYLIESGSSISFESKITTINSKKYFDYYNKLICIDGLVDKGIIAIDSTNRIVHSTSIKVSNIIDFKYSKDEHGILTSTLEETGTKKINDSSYDSGLNATQVAIRDDEVNAKPNSRFASFKYDPIDETAAGKTYLPEIEENQKLPTKINLSNGFVYGNYNTWSVSDLVLLYLYDQGYLAGYGYGPIATGLIGVKTNFQRVINNGGVDVDIRRLITQNASGATEVKTVVLIKNTTNDALVDPGYRQDFCMDYNVFMTLRSRSMSRNIVYENLENKNADGSSIISIEVQTSDYATKTPSIKELYLNENYEVTTFDFSFLNNYYFNENKKIFSCYNLEVPADVIKLIENGKVSNLGYILNLKLSKKFNINSVSTWTLLDYIIISEYSRTDVKNNYFKDFDFSDLRKDNPVGLYVPPGMSNMMVLSINGRYYNLGGNFKDSGATSLITENVSYLIQESKLRDFYGKDYIQDSTGDSDGLKLPSSIKKEDLTKTGNDAGTIYSDDYINEVEKNGFYTCGIYLSFGTSRALPTDSAELDKLKYNGSLSLITAGSPTNNNIKTPYETKNFMINPAARQEVYYNLVNDSNTLEFKENDSTTAYRKIANTSILYVVNTSKFYVYDVSKSVKKVSWPQKLMNDMQVIYPDLSWSTLFATGGWLDNLGDFSSAYASGEYNSEGNSANITAAGMVLS